jgi:hypothetical protein
MKALIVMALLATAGAASAETQADQTITVYRAGKPTVYDSNRKPYIDDRLRTHRLQEEAPPAPDNKVEKKDRAIGTG